MNISIKSGNDFNNLGIEKSVEFEDINGNVGVYLKLKNEGHKMYIESELCEIVNLDVENNMIRIRLSEEEIEFMERLDERCNKILEEYLESDEFMDMRIDFENDNLEYSRIIRNEEYMNIRITENSKINKEIKEIQKMNLRNYKVRFVLLVENINIYVNHNISGVNLTTKICEFVKHNTFDSDSESDDNVSFTSNNIFKRPVINNQKMSDLEYTILNGINNSDNSDNNNKEDKEDKDDKDDKEDKDDNNTEKLMEELEKNVREEEENVKVVNKDELKNEITIQVNTKNVGRKPAGRKPKLVNEPVKKQTNAKNNKKGKK